MAKPVTRKEAAEIFSGNYRRVGKDVPKGGLFGTRSFGSNFFGE